VHLLDEACVRAFVALDGVERARLHGGGLGVAAEVGEEDTEVRDDLQVGEGIQLVM